MAKRSKQDFSVEYGIYKAEFCGFIREPKEILVKRGFYDYFHARRKANILADNTARQNGNHLTRFVVHPM